jgi:hypothetical protein
VPKVPLLIAKFALISGVLGANDIIENPKRKNIELKNRFSFFVN